MTIPSWMQADDVAEIIDSHREWIALERAKQRPRLRLDPRSVSETEARRAVRELVTMVIDDEASVECWENCALPDGLIQDDIDAVQPFELCDGLL